MQTYFCPSCQTILHGRRLAHKCTAEGACLIPAPHVWTLRAHVCLRVEILAFGSLASLTGGVAFSVFGRPSSSGSNGGGTHRCSMICSSTIISRTLVHACIGGTKSLTSRKDLPRFKFLSALEHFACFSSKKASPSPAQSFLADKREYDAANLLQ